MGSDDKGKHLEMIQAVVGRMAKSSFLLKGWSITLLLAVVALVAKDGNQLFALFGPLSALLFWGLDGFYLRQEKLFRTLFDAVRSDQDKGGSYSLDATGYGEQVGTWFKICRSRTLLAFHGAVSMIAFAVATMALIDFCGCVLANP